MILIRLSIVTIIHTVFHASLAGSIKCFGEVRGFWHSSIFGTENFRRFFPFLTAASNPADTAEMFHEMATTLHFSYPVFVILISALFYGKKLSKNQLWCTALAMFGILFLNDSTSAVNYSGVVLALLSGVILCLIYSAFGKT